MQLYKNLSGNSNVYGYDFGPLHIEVIFRSKYGGSGDCYFYSINSVGKYYLECMKKYATEGHGLNTLISTKDLPVNKGYENRRFRYINSVILKWKAFNPNDTNNFERENFIIVALDNNKKITLIFKLLDLKNFMNNDLTNYAMYYCLVDNNKNEIINYMNYYITPFKSPSGFNMIIVNFPWMSY